MIPLRGWKRQLAPRDPIRGHELLEIIPLFDVTAADVLDLAVADDALARLVSRFREGGDVGHVGAEEREGRVVDFAEAGEAGEEGAPEHWCEGVSLGVFFPVMSGRSA